MEKIEKTEKIEKILEILKLCSINVTNINDLEGFIIERDSLLSDDKYEEIQKYIPSLKIFFSSSTLTALQSNACINQKWPVINIVRQLLKNINFKLTPLRKCDGYTINKKKKYKRYFLIEKYKIISNVNII